MREADKTSDIDYIKITDKLIDDIITDKNFANYDRDFKHIKKDKKHKLSKKQMQSFPLR